MRHSSLDLTMLARRGENVYTDPTLLDVAGALWMLPDLSLDDPADRAPTGHGGTAERPAIWAEKA